MEYYNMESDYTDSLEFLSPPVKRIHNIREVSVGSVYNNTSNNVQVLRQHKHTKSHEKITLSKRNRKACVESSTSLILQKTSERQILDRCSIVSYTSLHASKLNTTQLKKSGKSVESKAKPLIRVTVIPKSGQAHTAKLLRKRRHTTNRIQSTLSNLENSIQTKNVYLVVAGRRKDKIYEIKTTGSATFSSDHTDRNDKLSVDALSNVRQLIKSLNMDRTPIDEKQHNSNEQFFANCDNDPYKSEEFVTFPYSLKTEKRSINRSRVRIYGQLGLTNDDRYVLRYGATVNDQPVSDFGQLVSDPSKDVTPMTRAVATHNDSRLFTKDASIQASYEEICEQTRSAATYFPFGATQGTQVNFNVRVSTRKNQGHEYVRTNEQNTQCSCNNIPEKCESQNLLNDCPSPLVIISVYPKPSPVDITNKSTKIKSTSAITRKLSPTRNNRHMTTETTRVRVAKVEKNIDKKTDGKRVNKRDTSGFRNGDTSPLKNGAKSPVRNRDRSPERYGGKSLIRNRDTSPTRVRNTLPARNRNTSPTRYGDTSRAINRNTSPVRYGDKSPVRNRDTSPVRYRDTSPIRQRDTLSLRNRDTSPVRYEEASPVKNGDTKKKKRHVGSSETPSPIKNKTEADNDLVVSKATKAQNVKQTIENNKTLNIIKKNILDDEKHEEDVRNFRKCTHMQQHNKKTKHNQGHFNEMQMHTEQAKAKKVLVDNYTKTLNKHWIQKDLNRVNASNSKVRVSIDAENEYYNVLLSQSKFEDPRNKNTMKPSCSNYNRCRKLPESLQNLFEIPDKETTVHPISIAVFKQNEDIPESERISGLTIRDSLEISHRRGDKSYYMKNTQTCFANCNDYVINDSQYVAPIKHYIGDDCSISDPIQRDKEIRELLGVDKTKAYSSDDDIQPYSCFYWRQCEKSHIAQFNLIKLCPCLNNKKTTKKKDTECIDCVTETCPELCCPYALCKINAECLDGQTARCLQENVNKDTRDKIQQHDTLGPNIQPNKQQCVNHIQRQHELVQKQTLLEQQQQQLNLQKQMLLQQQEQYIRQQVNTGLCCSANKIEQESSNVNKDKENTGRFDTLQKNTESSAIYQQLILNRNIQVFLQVEQFSKQRPIVLSRKQYDKVKKTIQSTNLSSRDKRKKILGKFTSSNVSVGEVRKKTNIEIRQSCDQKTQADLITSNKTIHRKVNKKYRKKSGYKRNKFERCCDQKPGCFNYESSTTCCSSWCSESYRKRYSENCQRSNHNRIESNGGCYEPYEDCCMQRGGCEPAGDNCIAQDYSPSGFCNYTEPCYPPTCENYPKQSKFTCNTENQTMTGDICDPSELISQYNKAVVNVEQGVGEYKIQRQFSAAQPIGKVPYRPSELHVTGPELYRQYNEVVEEFTDRDLQQPPVYFDKTPGPKENNLDLHVRVNKSEKQVEVSKELVGYSTKLEQQVGQREFKTYIENKQCEIPRRLNADINLLKTTDQSSNNNVQLEYRRRDRELKNTTIGCNAKNNDNHRFMANKTLSSIEIHFTSLAYTEEQRLDISTTDIAVLSESSVAPVQSFQTIFRGHRKTPTPNLGTSIFSLFSGEGRSEKSTTYIMAPKDVKPTKKPFLRRLMSCLVMRSTRVSELKLPATPVEELPSVNSSIDSYHISTSLGAVEVSSSIYDTSASFYSNHSILPINSKIKRGFLSSVRGFLTNRKS